MTDTAEVFWEAFYQDREQVWSGRPNELLVRETAELAPGTALDIGCAEGGDALWLAARGWQVTATDISQTALRRAAARAAREGLEIDWQHHNLTQSFPTGIFDLVSAQYLHSPGELAGSREPILRRATHAVAPGGTLLIAGHAGFPTWQHDHHDLHFPTTAKVLTSLDLEPGRWVVERDEVVTRDHPGPEGQPGIRTDNLLRLRRSG
jgi:SAM-dependent methyltransferase